MKWLRNILGLKPYDPWEHGICHNRIARRHKKKKNVQFVLWPAGYNGWYKEDYWCNFDSSWWKEFTPIPMAKDAVSSQIFRQVADSI